MKNYFFPKNAEHHKVAMEYEVKNDAKYDGVPLKKRDFMEAIDNVIGEFKMCSVTKILLLYFEN